MEEIESLLEKVSIISKKYDDIAIITGEKFNIFQILDIEYSEQKHTYLITELLNPHGNHGQGTSFLELFLNEISEKEEKDYDNKFKIKLTDEIKNIEVGPKYIGVINENYTKGGVIDILITLGDKKIIIENKIYAADQKAQLIRYNNEYENAPLYYLSLSKTNKPTEYSIILKDEEGKITNEVKEKKHYKCISYEVEILNWLKKCKEKAVDHSLLRETITQYIYTINFITNQTSYHKMADELVEIFTNSPKNLKTLYEINSIKGQVENQLLKKLWDDLTAFASEQNFNRVDKDTSESIYFTNNFSEEKSKMEIIISFETTGFKNLWFGFTKNSETPKSILDFVLIKFREAFNKKVSITEYNIGIYHPEHTNWGKEEFLKVQSCLMLEDFKNKLIILFGIAKSAEKEFENKALKEQNQ